jgi:hypothetical protein
MPITHYIAETDTRNQIAAVWFKPKGQKVPRVFNASRDRFDPREPAMYFGAAEADITRWLLERSEVIPG